MSGDDESDEALINQSIAPTTNHDFYFEDNEIDGFELDLDDKDDELLEDERVSVVLDFISLVISTFTFYEY